MNNIPTLVENNIISIENITNRQNKYKEVLSLYKNFSLPISEENILLM